MKIEDPGIKYIITFLYYLQGHATISGSMSRKLSQKLNAMSSVTIVTAAAKSFSYAELSKQHKIPLTGQVLISRSQSKRGCVRPFSLLFLLCKICAMFPCEEGSLCILSQGSQAATSRGTSVQRLTRAHIHRT